MLVDGATSGELRANSFPRTEVLESLAAEGGSTLVVVTRGANLGSYDRVLMNGPFNATTSGFNVRVLVDVAALRRNADRGNQVSLALTNVLEFDELRGALPNQVGVSTEVFALASSSSDSMCASLSASSSIDETSLTVSVEGTFLPNVALEIDDEVSLRDVGNETITVKGSGFIAAFDSAGDTAKVACQFVVPLGFGDFTR